MALNKAGSETAATLYHLYNTDRGETHSSVRKKKKLLF